MTLLEKVKANLILDHDSTGGFFADSALAGRQAQDTINSLLRLNRDWKV
jgi:hypothetical protein